MPLVGTVKDTVDALLPLLEPKARTAHLDRMTAHYRRARSRLDKPQAIGAQATHPGRQVVALSGDGGLAMLLGELLTLHQMQLPVKIVVFNNGALSFVELEMKAAGVPAYATDLVDPDFTGIALVDVRTSRQELSLPPKLTYGQIKGFTLYATTTVLSGEGSELIELTKSNLPELEVE